MAPQRGRLEADLSAQASENGDPSRVVDLHFGEWRPFLVFNVADAAISIGVVILLVGLVYVALAACFSVFAVIGVAVFRRGRWKTKLV